MRRRLAVVAARIARAVRGLWPDRNPMRRTLDRVEGVIMGGLAIAFLAGAPLAAVATWHAAYSYGARTAHVQQMAWHRVPAVLLTSVPSTGDGYQATVQARWRTPDGERRTGPVPAPRIARPGATVMVWVDAAGRLTGPPLQPSQVKGQAVLAAVFAPVVLGLVVLCAGQLAHWLLGRRRLAAWDAEWRATGPQWTRQR
jgi:hypothetical protein